MLTRFRRHLTFANVTSVLALFVALGGTGAYAINEWTGANIQNETLTSADIRGKAGTATTAGVNGTIASGDIAGQQGVDAIGQPFVDGTITGWDVKNNSLGGADIDEDRLTTPLAAVRRTTPQDVNDSGFFEVLRFGFEELNWFGLHNNDPAVNERLTATIPGVYRVTANIGWEADPSGKRDLVIERVRSGAHDNVARSAVPATPTGETFQSVSAIVMLQAGDYVYAVAAETATGDPDVIGFGSPGPMFMMEWIAPR